MWSRQSEDLLHRWHAKAKSLSSMHRKCADRRGHTQTWFAPVLHGLNVITLSSSFVTTQQPADPPPAFVYLTLVSSALAALTYALDSALKLGELAAQHLNTSKEFDDVVLDIEQTLTMSRDVRGQRSSAPEMMHHVKRRISGLIKSAPPIDADIFDNLSLDDFEELVVNRHAHTRNETDTDADAPPSSAPSPRHLSEADRAQLAAGTCAQLPAHHDGHEVMPPRSTMGLARQMGAVEDIV
jgi:hypothetical protein